MIGTITIDSDVMGIAILLVILLVTGYLFQTKVLARNKNLPIEDLQPCFNRKQCREFHSNYFENFPMPDASAPNGYSYVRYCNVCNWSADITTQGFTLEKYLRENK